MAAKFASAVAVVVSLGVPCAAQTVLYEIPSVNRVALIGDVDADGIRDIGGWQTTPSTDFVIFSGRAGALIYSLPISCGQVIGIDDIDGDDAEEYVMLNCEPGYTAIIRSGRTSDVLYHVDPPGSATGLRGCKDLNGDALSDFLLFCSSSVYAYSGIDGALLWSKTLGLFGRLAGDADANFDGVSDVVAGTAPSGTDTLRVYFLSGIDGSTISDFSSTWDLVSVSEVETLDDITGDGIPEVLIGCASCPSGTQSGRVMIHSGADGSVVRSGTGFLGDQLGRAATQAHDLAGDGISEYVVGAPGEDSAFVNAGAVHVRAMDDDHEVLFISSPAQTPGFGADVFATDLTGDGLAEIIVAHKDGGIWALSGPCPSGEPENYCIAAPNSVGAGATMSGLGPRSIATNSFMLVVHGAPPGQPGLFFYGGGQTQYVLGNGFFCVAGGGIGVFRLSPQVVMGSGYATRHLDFTEPPAGSGAGQVKVGSSWNFQFWYRDPQAGGAGFNLSDGLTATFCP